MMGMEINSECECYFDALEDSLASTSGSDYESGEEYVHTGNMGYNRFSSGFPYDVWTRSPMSVEERRKLFRKWLERSSVQSNSCECSEEDIRLESCGAVSRTCSSIVDEPYLSWSSMLPCSDTLTESSSMLSAKETNICGIRNLEDATKSIMNDLKLEHQVGVCRKTLADDNSKTVLQCQSLPPSCSFQETKQKEIYKQIKNKWLRRLGSFTCTLDSQVKLDSVECSMSKCSCIAPRFRRVKVQQCRKRIKELSALYMGQEILAHRGSILTMKFSPDGQYLASAGEDMIVRVWQVVEEERSIKLDIPEIDPSCLYFTVNHLSDLAPLFVDRERLGTSQTLKKSSDSACVIFPPKVFRILETPLHEFIGHSGAVLDLSWSDKNHLLSSSDDSTVRLWRVGSDQCLQVFSHSNFVTCVEFNPVNDNYFISGCLDGKVRIWSITSFQVVDWIDIKELITAICYRPDAQGAIVGTISGSCHFFNISDNLLQRESCIQLHSKKKSPFKKITGFQFLPQDKSKVMVTCGDSKIRIMHGPEVIKKYKGLRSTGHKNVSLTTEGKHIVAAGEDSRVYVWNCNADEGLAGSHAKNFDSWEHFPANASVAIPWEGLNLSKMDREKKMSRLLERSNSLPFSTPACLCLNHEFSLDSFPKVTATWPEESLPIPSPLASRSSSMRKSNYKLFKTSCQSTSSSHAWGLVIVAAGWDGCIRSFHNYGLPVLT
ncbi:hypothetical protein QQ045_014095 [Rhodiola kirilowii]